MLNNKTRFKNKMHILLIVSFISVAIISFFFMTNKSYADTTDWSIPGYDGDFKAKEKVNADEPKNKYRIGIDDIVYNRVPLFDVNVFTDKPGGQEIDQNSPLFYLRTITANWFVLGMNLSLAAMIIIIIYTGIRMALTTIAEKKADYKMMLLNFVKAIAKIFVLAAIMALVINLCAYMTSLFAKYGVKPDDPIGGKNLYVTMVTRALGSFSFKAKIPAAILFFGLTLTFFKFCFRYTKRLLNVYLLIIISPVLVAKDAFEGSTGKQGRTFSAWLQEFTLNVALQPAHALIYTALVKVALESATDNILGFVVAILIMNFMISADKIFFKIFNMRFSKGPGAAGAADALTEGLKLYAGVQAAKEGAKLYGRAVSGTAKFTKNTARVIGGTAKNTVNKIASSDTKLGEKIRQDRLDKGEKKAKKDAEKRIEGEQPNGFLDTLNLITGKKNQSKREKAAGKAYNEIQEMDEINKGHGIVGKMPAGMRNYILDAKNDRAMKNLANSRKKDDKNFLSQMNELRKLASRNDETGRMTRKLLKMKKDHEMKKFKYVATSIAGVVAQGVTILAAPGLVAADETDMALMGVTATMGNTSTAIAKHYYYRRNAENELLTKRSFEDTLQSLKNVNNDLGTLQATFDAIEAHDRESRRDTYEKMKAYSELKLDEHTLRAKLNEYILKSGRKTFDESALDDMIDKVLADSGIRELGIETDQIKTALKAEMLNSQANNRLSAKLSSELNPDAEDGSEHKNRFSETEVVDLAKKTVEGEDISRLTDKQIVKMIDDVVSKANVDNASEVSRNAVAEVLKIADKQREDKFAEEMEKALIENTSEESTFEEIEATVESKAEELIKQLAVEKEEDKDKYVQMVLDQFGPEALSDEQREEIKQKVGEKVAASISDNYKNRDTNRFDERVAVDALSKSTNRFVEDEFKKLDKKGESGVLSEEVRGAINSIKFNVKHEQTKKGSIGTITDLDRRLRHMRDIY